MPTYSYKNKETGEEFDLSMTISEMVEYEDNNPKIERIYHKVAIVDPVGIGVSKPPADFQKNVLGRIKASVPESTAIASKRWSIPREI